MAGCALPTELSRVFEADFNPLNPAQYGSCSAHSLRSVRQGRAQVVEHRHDRQHRRDVMSVQPMKSSGRTASWNRQRGSQPSAHGLHLPTQPQTRFSLEDIAIIRAARDRDLEPMMSRDKHVDRLRECHDQRGGHDELWPTGGNRPNADHLIQRRAGSRPASRSRGRDEPPRDGVWVPTSRYRDVKRPISRGSG